MGEHVRTWQDTEGHEGTREDTGGQGRTQEDMAGVVAYFLVEEMKNFDSSLSPAAWTKRNIHALILKKTNYDVVFIRSGTN